ncbi:MAG: hypothetical protein DMG49_02025 [Acidobacteria bacterium]|nr:MAG: hypothetical protein DMG49_02025 [Acidobacteriota bacterium]
MFVIEFPGNLVDFPHRASQMLGGGAGLRTFIFVACSVFIEATRKPSLPPRNWQRQRAKGFYKFLTLNLRSLKDADGQCTEYSPHG